MKLPLAFAFLCLFAKAYEAKKYSKCELYEELKKYELDGYGGIDIGHWICLILFTSSYDTEHYEYTEGQPFYGLFHLSGIKWCTNGRHHTQNLCKIDCENFLDDDITDDVECAKEVAKSTSGMLSWVRFREYCSHPMPEVVFWECT